jgi:2-iminobutanoate/2-iminopropanoate deaminase
VTGHVGQDPKIGKPVASQEEESRLVMDGLKRTLEAARISVQVFCSDLSLCERFNAAYRSYVHQQNPARAFLGTGTRLGGARGEAMGMAVSRAKQRCSNA